MKRLICVLLSAFLVLLCGCQAFEKNNNNDDVSDKEDLTKTVVVMTQQQYLELYQKALIGGGMLSDYEQVFNYDAAQGIAPNENIIDLSVDNENYFLTVFSLDNGKLVCVYNEKENGNSPNEFMGMVYCSERTDSKKLSEALTVKNVFELTNAESNIEFAKYYNSAELSKFFYLPSLESETVSDFRTLHITDDGFYLVGYQEDMLNNEGDGEKPDFNMECKVVSVEKCELPEQEELYKKICSEIY